MNDTASLQTADPKNWLAAIVNSSDDIIISKSLEGIILSWNRAAERVFGYTSTEAIGKHISLIIPNDRQDEEYVILGKVRAGQSVDHFETIRRAKDGRLLDIMLTVSPIVDDQGQIIGISKIAKDVTSSRAAQRAAAHLAAIVGSSDDAIISKTLDGKITSWNAGAQKIFGYTSEEAIGSHITLLIPHEYLSDEDTIISKVSAGERLEHFETVRRTKTGELIDVSITVSPILDASGKIIGASKIARNVSEKKRTQALLDDASRRRDEFLANMSHELRTPMNAIIGLAHIVSHADVLRPKEKKAMEMLRRSADGLLVLINDLLDFSKIDQGDIDLDIQEFDLQATVRQISDLLEVKAAEKNLEFSSHYDADLSPLYRGDVLRIQQILTNLVGNAIKFTDHGRVDIQVKRLGPAEDASIALAVSDTGIGIPPDELGVIFEKFTQADSTMSRRYGGSGLGLSIARMLAQRMGGRIEVVSTPGIGSTFTAILPLERSAHNAPNRDQSLDRSHKPILIVDDYEANVLVLSTLIESLGYEFDVATNGLEAVRQASSVGYDLILMDVQMPGMDGFEATRRIREMESVNDFAPAQIVAVTAHVRNDDRQQCIDVGMDDFIPKPFNMAQIEAFLSQMLPGRARLTPETGSGAAIIRFNDVKFGSHS